jgi:hypothetical protein
MKRSKSDAMHWSSVASAGNRDFPEFREPDALERHPAPKVLRNF